MFPVITKNTGTILFLHLPRALVVWEHSEAPCHHAGVPRALIFSHNRPSAWRPSKSFSALWLCSQRRWWCAWHQSMRLWSFALQYPHTKCLHVLFLTSESKGHPGKLLCLVLVELSIAWVCLNSQQLFITFIRGIILCITNHVNDVHAMCTVRLKCTLESNNSMRFSIYVLGLA